MGWRTPHNSSPAAARAFGNASRFQRLKMPGIFRVGFVADIKTVLIFRVLFAGALPTFQPRCKVGPIQIQHPEFGSGTNKLSNASRSEMDRLNLRFILYAQGLHMHCVSIGGRPVPAPSPVFGLEGLND